MAKHDPRGRTERAVAMLTAEELRRVAAWQRRWHLLSRSEAVRMLIVAGLDCEWSGPEDYAPAEVMKS